MQVARMGVFADEIRLNIIYPRTEDAYGDLRAVCVARPSGSANGWL